MASVDPYINAIIALLGVAYPILLQVIARLDERYESEHISLLFKTEWEWKAFNYTLVTSLVSVLIWSLNLPPLIEIEGFNFIIENSATIIICISAILLIISFFLFVKKVLKYYTTYTLIPYLIKKHSNSGSEVKYFSELTDLLLLSIKKQHTNLTKTLSGFFYAAFRRVRDKFTNEPVVYPYLYYETVYRAIEELAILKEKRNYPLEARTSGGIWLLGEHQGKVISEDTYNWLWRNLLLGIHYQQDDLIVNHWQTCHQYFSHHLQRINEEYDYSEKTIQISNQDVVSQRMGERERFLTFHCALGGLLTYKSKYKCMKRLFSYTQSWPPQYELLPETMDEIFKSFSDFRDPYELKHPWLSSQYPFPELSGLRDEFAIKEAIMKYMAILFLRQYTIVPYLISMRPLDFPPIPDSQGEIKQWIEGMDLFKKMVTDHLQNAELLKTLSLDFITRKWCTENGKTYPIDFIEELKAQLEKAYHLNAKNLPISPEKVLQFEQSTTKIIQSTFKQLQRINNVEPIQGTDVDKWYVNGQTMHQDKDAFSETPEIHHIDFDSFLASVVSKKLNDTFADTFFQKKTKSFLLKDEDIFRAIDKLSIDDSFVIINFGISLEHFIKNLRVVGLSTDHYKGTPIYSFKDNSMVRNSLFILKGSDLPKISTMPIDKKIRDKYSLKKISTDIDLYSSVIDLNDTTTEIYKESIHGHSDEELRKSVLLSIILSAEFKWKRNIEVVQIRQSFEFLMQGIVNALSDVVSINKDKSKD